VSSALNPFAIARLMNGDYSKSQFLALYILYGAISGLLSVAVFAVSSDTINSTILLILFGGVLGSIINAFMYVVLINNQRGGVIMLSTCFAAVTLLLTVLVLPIKTAVVAIFIALSFNVIDLLFKLFYLFRKIKISSIASIVSFDGMPVKSSFYLMIALLINGGVFLYQRHLLTKEPFGFEQMGYLEVVMQLYAIVTIFLTALANGLMRERSIKIIGIRLKGIDAIAIFCFTFSLLYSALIIIFSKQISYLYNITTYSFAFFSVRLLIVQGMQKLNLFSTLISSILCFSVYFFVNISVLSIVISYCIFFFFLGVINVVLYKATVEH
jgi:hypothetical protein